MRNLTFPNGSKFSRFDDVKNAVSGAYQDALKWSKRDIGAGCYRSRGKWLKAIDANGNLLAGDCDSWEWDGTLKSLIAAINETRFGEPKAVALFLEGGIDYAASLRDFSDGAYDPWVGEWSVAVWEKPEHHNAVDSTSQV
jgi:hypothetical protein